MEAEREGAGLQKCRTVQAAVRAAEDAVGGVDDSFGEDEVVRYLARGGDRVPADEVVEGPADLGGGAAVFVLEARRAKHDVGVGFFGKGEELLQTGEVDFVTNCGKVDEGLRALLDCIVP